MSDPLWPVASRYTDYATPAHDRKVSFFFLSVHTLGSQTCSNSEVTSETIWKGG
jgi:hypothetical protein